MKTRLLPLLCAVALAAIAPVLVAQTSSDAQALPRTAENAAQVANILGISDLVTKARAMRSQQGCGSSPTLEDLAMRQEILETVVSASLQVDGVLAELENERARLFEFSSILQARRDRGVNLANVANLVTGTGLGIAVNAMQFSNSTANIGNGLGVASGIGSTVLSIAGIRLQRGPQRSLGRIPNMLGQLFGREARLNAYYPQIVVDYLHGVPPGEPQPGNSRLDQLMAEWRRAGRIGPAASPKSEDKITRLTSSLEQKTKLSIDDISDRTAMLADVSGTVALMQRDLAALMLLLRTGNACATQ